MTIKSKLFSGLLIPKWIPFFLVLMIAPLVASADCNWGGGGSTPQSVFDRSCRQQGGVPHGCSCDAPGAGNSGNSNYDNGAAQRAQAEATAAEAQRERDAELEQQRIEADNKRRMEEIANQAKFIDDRNAAASTLRGSTGSATSGWSDNSGLRGSSATTTGAGESGLRGSGASTEIHGLRPATAQTPNSDPMVVDARHVPSNLPESVDKAIPHTPAGDRVRKGFEAIQAGDWKVALAWFQDAHNKEPRDPGIRRLVELAKFTLDYRTPAQTTHSPNQNNPIKSNDGAAVDPGDSHLARIAANQMAARARADAAFKKYVEKYGDRDVAGRTSAVSKAARGEGYTNEELKAQLQKALVEYRKNYHKNHPNGPDERVNGGRSPTADEIVLGGKG